MKSISSILILFIAFSLGNAQDVTVNADHDRSIDFSQYETFAIMDREGAELEGDRQDRQNDEARRTGDRGAEPHGMTEGRHRQVGTGGGVIDDNGEQGAAREQDGFTEDRGQEMEGETGRGQAQGRADDANMRREGREGVVRDRAQQGTFRETERDRALGTTRDRDAMADREDEGMHRNQHQFGEKAHKDKHGIEQAIRSQLEDKGLSYSESNPDLLINYHVFDGDSDFVMGRGTDRYTAWGPNIMQGDVANITEGSIVVHIVDAERNQLVYQAIAESPNGLDQESVDQVVENVLNDFGNLIQR